MCLDSELISAFTCVIFTEHVHTNVPEIGQHPDQRWEVGVGGVRAANDQ